MTTDEALATAYDSAPPTRMRRAWDAATALAAVPVWLGLYAYTLAAIQAGKTTAPRERG